MHTNKRYTNTTFTKRVDHLEPHPQPDAPCVCRECGAIYENRHWRLKSPTGNRKTARPLPTRLTICPACVQKAEGVPGGYLYLEGAFVTAHRPEIERLLKNEARRAAAKNPLARIMTWATEGQQKLTLTTTTEHLAQRLGHALEKAFSGTVEYDFSHENKLARVRWHRD